MTEREMLDNCACHRVRTAARAVTRAYDEALRPTGLRATQVALLAATATDEGLSIAALARLIGMDRSTLTRNLRPLEGEGLVQLGNEGWRRSRMLRITRKGRERLKQAMPLWEKAQDNLRSALGEHKWAAIRSGLSDLIRVA